MHDRDIEKLNVENKLRLQEAIHSTKVAEREQHDLKLQTLKEKRMIEIAAAESKIEAGMTKIKDLQEELQSKDESIAALKKDHENKLKNKDETLKSMGREHAKSKEELEKDLELQYQQMLEQKDSEYHEALKLHKATLKKKTILNGKGRSRKKRTR